MTRLLISIAAACAAWSGSVFAAQPSVEIWHSNTVWAGQGMCSANFTIDSGMPEDPLGNLRIMFEVIDPKGKKVAADVLEYDGPIGDSNATRYDTAFWESEMACEDDLHIVILGASARVDGKNMPIQVTPRSFTPFKIVTKK